MNFLVLFSFTSFEQGIHFLRGLCDFSKKFWSDRFFVTKCTLFCTGIRRARLDFWPFFLVISKSTGKRAPV